MSRLACSRCDRTARARHPTTIDKRPRRERLTVLLCRCCVLDDVGAADLERWERRAVEPDNAVARIEAARFRGRLFDAQRMIDSRRMSFFDDIAARISTAAGIPAYLLEGMARERVPYTDEGVAFFSRALETIKPKIYQRDFRGVVDND